MAENDRVTRIADAIERYMREHPRAADTAEGVRSWWIANECRNDPPGEVQNALDHLAASGRIGRIVLLDGTIVYGNPQRPDQ